MRKVLIIVSFKLFFVTICMSQNQFKIAPNTSVFSTKFVVEEQKLITYVTHDLEDGAWQFFSNDKFEDFESIARVVSIQQIIKLDNSILELADMPKGYYAIRESKQDKWKIYKQE